MSKQRDVIPFEPFPNEVGPNGGITVDTVVGAMSFWLIDADAGDAVCMARMRGILMAYDPKLGLPINERLNLNPRSRIIGGSEDASC